jgi:solute carrier family 13 (sodium-dependent dicarboxylate transporter), member 2/3/5
VTGVQTVCLFVTGYLVSRLMLRADAHLVFVDWLVGWSRGRASRVVLGVMLAAFFLSTIVPNALTVLALIPVVIRLKAWSQESAGDGADDDPDDGTSNGAEDHGFGTVLAMALIYGANLGGVGSLLGSPANLYLLVNLSIFDIAGRESLHFVSWLLFGLPMATTLVFLGWGMLRLTERRAMTTRLPGWDRERTGQGPLFGTALRWSALWGVGWVVLLVVALVHGGGRTTADATWRLVGRFDVTTLDLVALAGSAIFTLALFVRRVNVSEAGTQGGAGERSALLRIRDLWREVPVKGVLLGLGVLVLLVVVAKSGAVGWLKSGLPHLLPDDAGLFPVALVLVLVTIFATEVLNNTTVSTVLFPLSAAVAGGVGVDPLLLMLGVSLASTCAFMTPVATPVNALAFGGIKGVSLGKFLKNGLIMNLVSAVWIAAWITWLIPPILGWFGASQ